MAESIVDNELWNEFHRVVNMPAPELRDWLHIDAAGPEAEPYPARAEAPLGERVLAILGKRRTDLDDHDVAVMRTVVRRVRAEREPEPESTAGGTEWRHALMSIGHDPLRSP
ncbi:DUF3140 domain-containing protein [Nocardia wallacei]|uniref:DUF3140 domain-containing protein n=1 Tax=Nocardia wallacei TaxID=480035 RepID=UPI002458A7EC|nr:DUF3140 domain-containing protein [Nocardia wallacei]